MPNHGIYESYIPRPWNIRIVYSTTMEYTIYSIERLYGRYVIYLCYNMVGFQGVAFGGITLYCNQ